jgi:NAD+ kinase
MSNNTFKTIGLFGKYGDPGVADTLKHLSNFLLSRDCEVYLHEDTASTIPDNRLATADTGKIGEICELAITVGGDGTLLHAARLLADYNVALLGVNLGRLGFLVDVSPDQMQERMSEILDGNYLEEHRVMLHAEIINPGSETRSSYAFNDVVVHKWEMARMIETETYINGRLLNTMRSDGLILSTATGSTAYALSGGGPILEPDMEAMVLVPICPHSMSYRPIVIDSNSEIEILVHDYPASQAQVTCDGQINMKLEPGDRIRINRKQDAIRLIHPPEHDHYQVLRAKLHWSEHL